MIKIFNLWKFFIKIKKNNTAPKVKNKLTVETKNGHGDS